MTTNLRRRERIDWLLNRTFKATGLLTIAVLDGIFFMLLYNSVAFFLDVDPVDFFTGSQWNPGRKSGGILPAVIGTLWLTLITTLFSVPFGVACAVYLNEYAPPNALTGIIRASIRNLAEVPSIIYGLFGLALFVQGMGLGTSVLAAGLTLGLLSLPYIITTTEEALKQIPNSTREAALASVGDWYC